MVDLGLGWQLIFFVVAVGIFALSYLSWVEWHQIRRDALEGELESFLEVFQRSHPPYIDINTILSTKMYLITTYGKYFDEDAFEDYFSGKTGQIIKGRPCHETQSVVRAILKSVKFQ